MTALLGEITIGGGVTVMVAVPLRELSALATAVTVTVFGDGTVFGAVYNPSLLIVPTVEFPPSTPLTCQVTAVLVVEKMTDAENCCVALAATEAVEGLTVTGSPITMEACAVLFVLALETAVIVTVEGLGIVSGAVYNPALVMVPCFSSPPLTPFTSQVTPLLLVPVTFAVNCCVDDMATLAAAGVIVTEMSLEPPPPHAASATSAMTQIA
jgi:hypothetical protein